MTGAPIIVWFRRDLRVADNPALHKAAQSGRPIIPLYIHETGRKRRLGAARKLWLSLALADLGKSLKAAGVDLILREGEAASIINEIINVSHADTVYWNRRYAKDGRDIDEAIKTDLKSKGLSVESFNANLLSEPWEIKTKTDGYYKVFTPYWRNAQSYLDISNPLPAPPRLKNYPKSLLSDDLDLVSSGQVNGRAWAEMVMEDWTASEAGAHENLQDFLSGPVKTYAEDRNRPDIRNGTSKLSPYLASGQISPRQIWHAAKQSPFDTGKFLSEIGWREFSYVLLFHNPNLAIENFKPDFDAFPWDEDEQALERWQKGQTGYPFVDAGMRELWQTGWQHNRVRMVCASFLIKHLLLDWRSGEVWYWDTLLEADPASNAASWQWVAGSGADASPYFRIFNPFTQGEKFDPKGDYVRRFVPELKEVPNKYIHRPWDAPANVLKDAGVTLGETYPNPMVDHKEARERALQAYKETRSN